MLIKEALITEINEVSRRILAINIRGGKCTAHLYHLEHQGDSLKSRYIYRCIRAGCHHYSTLTAINARLAQCRHCGNTFAISAEAHVIQSKTGKTIEELFSEFIVCCDGIKESIPSEVASLEFEFLKEIE